MCVHLDDTLVPDTNRLNSTDQPSNGSPSKSQGNFKSWRSKVSEHGQACSTGGSCIDSTWQEVVSCERGITGAVSVLVIICERCKTRRQQATNAARGFGCFKQFQRRRRLHTAAHHNGSGGRTAHIPAVKPSPLLHGFVTPAAPLNPAGGSALVAHSVANSGTTDDEPDRKFESFSPSRQTTYIVPKLPTLWMPNSMYLPFSKTSLPTCEDL
jgi:hypothetical protein